LDNINDDKLDKLAELIISKLFEKQNQWYLIAEREDQLLGELARLHPIMAIHEENEEYMKAAVIKNKIDILEYRIDKLNGIKD
jgi:hypothetical protein